LIWTGAGVGESWLDVYVGILTKLCEICSQRRLKFFVVDGFLNAILDLLQGCDSSLYVFIGLVDYETLF